MELERLFYIVMAITFLRPGKRNDKWYCMLGIIKELAKPGQKIFIGVIDPINPKVETPKEVRDRVLEAAEYIAPHRLGTTDDCGFAPFGDDTSTAREIAFEKIHARVAGTELAARALRV